MNHPPETPQEALLELISQTREQRSATILEQARVQARERVCNAFQEARRRVTHAIAAERQRAAARLARQEAQLETHDRRRYQDAVQHLLARARYRLDTALLARWAQADSRRLWLEQLLEQAVQRLPASPWTVEHPADWDVTEIRHWQERITALSGRPPDTRTRTGLRAGVRILAGGVCLDGSLDGLLSDEGAVQARLLAHLEAALPDSGPGASS